MKGKIFFGILKHSNLKFFDIPNYYSLFPPCIDHDIFEGILPKVTKCSLKYFPSKKFFTLNEFFYQVKSFKFSGKDKQNFPLINKEFYVNLRFTASEGYYFSRFF